MSETIVTGIDAGTEAFTPFAILTSRLLMLPTPIAITRSKYTAMYAALHADPAFCTMAFGTSAGSFQPVDWTTDNKVLQVIAREVRKSWDVRAMGDFAVGLLPSGADDSAGHGLKKGVFRVVEGAEFQAVCGTPEFESIKWIGYCGVRDATTTSIPVWGGKGVEETSSKPAEWQEMVELRYGFHDSAWGKGYGTEAALAVMGWCEERRGARRFIAETETKNGGSRGILRKLGFTMTEDTSIWGLEGTVEWERRCGSVK